MRIYIGKAAKPNLLSCLLLSSLSLSLLCFYYRVSVPVSFDDWAKSRNSSKTLLRSSLPTFKCERRLNKSSKRETRHNKISNGFSSSSSSSSQSSSYHSNPSFIVVTIIFFIIILTSIIVIHVLVISLTFIKVTARRPLSLTLLRHCHICHCHCHICHCHPLYYFE